MGTINIQYYNYQNIEFILGSFEHKLCLLDYRYRKMRMAIDSRIQKGFNANYHIKDDAILQQTRTQLEEYFNLTRKEFNIPITTTGTDFQQSVWNALLNIPYGTTCSYLELAKNINNEKAVRAVANANGANAIGIIIPCHRVIGASGKLMGYAGGLSVKQKLLKVENNIFNI